MALGDLIELCEQRVGLAQLAEVGDSRQRQLDLGVDELLASGDLRQVQDGVNNGVQTADVGNHRGGVDLAGGHHLDGFLHVAGVAAGGTDHMGVEVMDVVPVEFRLELAVGRAGEEVEAAVEAEDIAGLLNNGLYGGEADDIVVAGAAGELAQIVGVAAGLGRVDVVQLNAHFLRVLNGVDALGARESGVVDIGDDEQARTAVAVQCVVDGTEAHGADRGEHCHLAALNNAHLMLIGAGLSMVHGVERADDAAHRLCQRAIEIGIGVVRQEIVGQQRLDGDVGILAVAAAVLVGIAGSQLRALVEVGGLDGKALTGFVLVLPVFADLGNHTAEFVADDRRVLRDVVGDALVLLALDCGLVGRHADRVGNDLDLNIIRADLREFDLLQAKVHFAMDTDSFRFHRFHSFLEFTLQKSSNRKWDYVGLY